MVIDSSAVVAIIAGEEGAEDFEDAIIADERRIMSAVTFVESAMVLGGRLGGRGVRALERYLARSGVVIESATATIARGAVAAFESYGKGRHKAALNLGDCFVYALAKELGEPILCKGNDFRLTDVSVVPLGPIA